MNKLRSIDQYFVFCDYGQKKLTLLDHVCYRDLTEVSEYVQALNETSPDEYREQGFARWPTFVFMVDRAIKRRPEYLQAFRDYFGLPRIEFGKNKNGKIVGMRGQGIPPEVDLRKHDLGKIATIPDDPFTPPVKLLSRKKTKVA